MPERDDIEKITDMTIHMPINFTVRVMKRTLKEYKYRLEFEGKDEKEIETLVHIEFMRLRRDNND